MKPYIEGYVNEAYIFVLWLLDPYPGPQSLSS